MKTVKERPVDSSIFAYKDNMTLVSYKPMPKKVVIVLSTLHVENDNVVQVERMKTTSLNY